MSLKVAKTLDDDVKHSEDVEAVVVSGNRVFSSDDAGVVKSPFKRPSSHMLIPKADLQAVILRAGRLLTTGDDGKVKIFDHDLNLLKEFKAHNYAVNDMVVIQNNLFTACADCTLRVWDADTLALKKEVEPHEEAVRKLQTDGTRVFAGDDKGEIRVYSAEGDVEAIHSVVEEVWGLHVQDDLFYSVRDRGITISKTHASGKISVMYSNQDGRAPLYVNQELMACGDRDGFSVNIFDNTPGSYKLLRTLKGHEMIITALAGNGTTIASAGWDKKVILWDAASGQQLGSCEVPGCANGLAITEGGKEVFVGGVGGFLCKLVRA